MTGKMIKTLRKTFAYYAYLLLVWGFFRLLFKFPDLIEEVWFKPLIWLLPLLWLWLSDKKQIKFFDDHWLKSLLWGGGLGLFYVVLLLLMNLIKTGGHLSLNIGQWGEFAGISLVTAISEEIVFAGFIFQKLQQAVKNGTSMIITVILFALIHVPISLFIYKYNLGQLMVYLGLVSLTALGNLYVFSKTKNVVAPVISHWLWSLAASVI